MDAPGQPNDAPKRSLTQRTTVGAAWNLLQLTLSRGVTAIGQVVLAWFLEPEAWGLIALTYTVTLIGEQVRNMGVQRVLVYRQKRFDRWSTPGFWFAATLGGIASLGVMGASFPMSLAYGEPALVGLICILACASPIRALAIVPAARMQIDLRFKLQAGLVFFQTTGTMTLTIIFAALGAGVYSFVWPQVIIAICRTLILWKTCGVPIKLSPQVRRWRYLFGDASPIFFAEMLRVISKQLSSVLLGLFFSTTVVGIYYFGLGLSSNPVRTITGSLSNILFPALTRLKDEPERQRDAFLRATRLLAIVAMPLCLLQAAVADPLVRLVLSDKWIDSIMVVQVLSVAACARVITSPGLNMILAQGRFRTYLLVAAIHITLMATCVISGALIGRAFEEPILSAVAVAAMVTVCFWIMSPLQVYVAVSAAGGGWRDVGSVYVAPMIASVLAMGPPMALSLLVPAGDEAWRHLARLAIVVVPSLPVYLVAIRLLRREDTSDLAERVRAVVKRRRGA